MGDTRVHAGTSASIRVQRLTSKRHASSKHHVQASVTTAAAATLGPHAPTQMPANLANMFKQ
jgi:hypothetical protein